MSIHEPRYSKADAGKRGDEIYDRDVRSQVEPQRNGEIVAIDLDTGAWEVDPDEITAAHRLEARYPDAQIWVVRVGSRYLARFGAGRSTQAV
jgi:hypothetical protein